MKGKYINQKSNSDHRKVYTECWDMEELEKYFADKPLPATIRLNGWTVITDVKNFVRSHLEVVKANNGNSTYLSYFERLKELIKVLN